MYSPLAGFPAYIYRAPGLINKGAASRNIFQTNDIVVIIEDNLPAGEDLPKFLSPEKGMPGVSVKKGTDLHLLYAEPVKPGNYEFGGTFIFSDHPSFYKLSPYPIPLHDRPKLNP